MVSEEVAIVLHISSLTGNGYTLGGRGTKFNHSMAAFLLRLVVTFAFCVLASP